MSYFRYLDRAWSLPQTDIDSRNHTSGIVRPAGARSRAAGSTRFQSGIRAFDAGLVVQVSL